MQDLRGRSRTAGSTRTPWLKWIGSAIPFVPSVCIAVGGWSHRWVDEDAFINFRVVDQIFAGHGPVFNAGERVEAATSPLWVGVLAVARALFGSFTSIEWIGLGASLVAATAAFAVGGQAARILHREEEGIVLPAGLILVAAVAVVWDFSTSGLEMGLVWLWLAMSWLALVIAARSESTTGAKRFLLAAVIGLAPLVRPELGLMMICLVAAWFWVIRPRRVGLDLVAMFLLPAVYEVFRMGFYAEVVPNTALAKDAGGAHWSQGFRYADDFIGAYRLWLTAALIIATIVISNNMRRGDVRRPRVAVITVAMLTAGALDALYIVVIGGDYMHGRLLLPAFFALALPASISVRRDVLASVGVLLSVTAWAALSAFAFRPPSPPKTFLLAPISDWRAVEDARLKPTDVTLNLSGTDAHKAYLRGVRGYFDLTDKWPRPARDPHKFVIVYASIGVPAYDAGREIFVVDLGGLAEPLGARAPPRGRIAGHRKGIDDAWYIARFTPETGDVKVASARRALRCQPLAGLIDAVDGPLTVGRFFSNLWHSVSFTRLRIPYDPRAAEAKFCRR